MVERVPLVVLALGVKQDRVNDAPEVLGSLARIAVCRRSLPDDLVDETVHTKDGVQQDLEVVARRRVAVQVERPGRLQGSAKLDEPDRHLDQVRHHLVLADPAPQRSDEGAHLRWDPALVAARVR